VNVASAVVWAWVAIAILGALIALGFVTHRRGRFRGVYHRHLRDTGQERLFLSSVSFFVTFAFVRALTHAIHAGRGPFHNISMGGLHIHHLVWGILGLLLVGYGWLLEMGDVGSRPRKWKARILSTVFGIAAALTLDEFALWLHLRDVYWEHEGKASVDAALLFGGLLSIGIWGGRFLHALVREALPGRR
jgi:hypothetical protein